MKIRTIPLTLAVSGLLAAAPAWVRAAPLATSNPITIENAWSRAASAGQTAAVYFNVTNTGEPDQLVSVSTPIAQEAAVHESFSDNGIMKMRPAGALPVAPGQPLKLAPGGYHVMLMGLTRPTSPGDRFLLTLMFQHVPAITVQVHVQTVGARSMSEADGMNMPSGGMSHRGM